MALDVFADVPYLISNNGGHEINSLTEKRKTLVFWTILNTGIINAVPFIVIIYRSNVKAFYLYINILKFSYCI